MSVQSIRVDVIPVVIIIILLKIAHMINPDHLHHERCSLKKILTGKLWTNTKNKCRKLMQVHCRIG